MEERIADIPAIVPLLERLTALALPLVHILDPMSVSNIFWALGTLRLSPGGRCHIIRPHLTLEHSLGQEEPCNPSLLKQASLLCVNGHVGGAPALDDGWCCVPFQPTAL